MRDELNRLRRQSRGGTVLVVGGAFLLAVVLGLVVFGDAPAIVLLAGVVPAGLLVYGYAARRAAKSETAFLTDEAEAAHRRAGLHAFWLLHATIIGDELVRVLPRAHLHESLIYVGTFAYVGLYVYYRYVPDLLAPGRGSRADG